MPKGLLCFLFPGYAGAAGTPEGWMVELVANGSAKMQLQGAFIANRYKTRGNIVWVLGGDCGTGGSNFTAQKLLVEQAMLGGVNSVAGQASLNFSAAWTDAWSFRPLPHAPPECATDKRPCR